MSQAERTPTTTNLKLPRLPDRMPAKILVTVPPDLKRQLAAYVELYREVYGEEESVETEAISGAQGRAQQRPERQCQSSALAFLERLGVRSTR